MNIKFNSEQLTNYIGFKLDIIENEFTEEQLNSLKELVIDYEYNLELDVLKYFSGLETLEIRNFNIDENTINSILSMKNLSNLSFQLCTFETTNNLDKLNLKELHLDCCKMNDYSFVFGMQNLERLTLSGQENLDILKINTLTNLKYLNISHTKCSSDVLNIQSLEELFIDGSNITNLNFIFELPNLKELSLSQEQYEGKEEIIEKIKNRNIEIYDYSIMLLGELE